MTMRPFVLALLAAASLAAPAPATAVAVALASATSNVSVDDNFFAPSSLSVKKGATVKWTWKGDSLHNVKVAKGPVTFQSLFKGKGYTFKRKLRKPGTYALLCTVHAGMKMTIKVKK